MSKAKLYYVHDPMCAWCWGYKPSWQVVEQALARELDSQIEIIYLVGGLAPDSDEPMPEEMQKQIASYWRKIENYLGTQFNYDFWSSNIPRRSTYPACRAVLAAREQGAEKAMLSAIQKAYYLRVLNPSDLEVLVGLAEELQLDSVRFRDAIQSADLNHRLLEEIRFARTIGGNSFPSLFFEREGKCRELPIEYDNPDKTLSQIRQWCQQS